MMISLKMNLMELVIKKKVLKESLKRLNLRSRRLLRKRSLKRLCLSSITASDAHLRILFPHLYALYVTLLVHQWK
jgi:hypothetical protein